MATTINPLPSSRKLGAAVNDTTVTVIQNGLMAGVFTAHDTINFLKFFVADLAAPFFPIIVLMDWLRLGLRFRDWRKAKNKNGAKLFDVLDATWKAAAATAAVVGIMVAPLVFAAFTPMIFTTIMGVTALTQIGMLLLTAKKWFSYAWGKNKNPEMAKFYKDRFITQLGTTIAISAVTTGIIVLILLPAVGVLVANPFVAPIIGGIAAAAALFLAGRAIYHYFKAKNAAKKAALEEKQTLIEGKSSSTVNKAQELIDQYGFSKSNTLETKKIRNDYYGYSTLLKTLEKVSSPEKKEILIQWISNKSDRLTRKIDSLNDNNKYSSNKKSVLLNLYSIKQEALAKLAEQINGKDLAFHEWVKEKKSTIQTAGLFANRDPKDLKPAEVQIVKHYQERRRRTSDSTDFEASIDDKKNAIYQSKHKFSSSFFSGKSSDGTKRSGQREKTGLGALAEAVESYSNAVQASHAKAN